MLGCKGLTVGERPEYNTPQAESNQPRGERMRRSFFFSHFGVGSDVPRDGVGPGPDRESEDLPGRLPLITESDLYCTIFVLDGELPAIRIVGAERQDEKILLSDADKFYVDKGKADGLEIGQVFLVVSVGRKIASYGFLARRTGGPGSSDSRRLGASSSSTRPAARSPSGISSSRSRNGRACSERTKGYSAELDESQGLKGTVIYLEDGVPYRGRRAVGPSSTLGRNRASRKASS